MIKTPPATTAIKSIRLNAEQVLALLGGQSIELRDALKPQPDWIRPAVGDDGIAHGYCGSGPEGGITCPHGRVGSAWWVKETSELQSIRGYNVPGATMTIRYAADWHLRKFNRDVHGSGYSNGGWIFGRVIYAAKMPRWVSRLTVITTAIRVELSPAGTWEWIRTMRRVEEPST